MESGIESGKEYTGESPISEEMGNVIRCPVCGWLSFNELGVDLHQIKHCLERIAKALEK